MKTVNLKQPVRPLIWNCPECGGQNEENLSKETVVCWYCHIEFITDISENQTYYIPVKTDGTPDFSYVCRNKPDNPSVLGRGWNWQKFKLVPVKEEKKYSCPKCGKEMIQKIIPVETKTGEVDMDVYTCYDCNVEVRGL